MSDLKIGDLVVLVSEETWHKRLEKLSLTKDLYPSQAEIKKRLREMPCEILDIVNMRFWKYCDKFYKVATLYPSETTFFAARFQKYEEKKGLYLL